MNNFIKNAFVLSTGVVIGIGLGAGYCVKKVLESEALRKAATKVVSDKISEFVFKDRQERVSYRSYYHWSNARDDDLIFVYREEAEKTLSDLSDILAKYGVVTVADYKYLVGAHPGYHDNNYGWTDLENARICRCVKNRYFIELPPARKL